MSDPITNGNSTDSIWPKDGPTADADKLIQTVEELAKSLPDPNVRAKISVAKAQYDSAKQALAEEVVLRDLPHEALQGRLGEICETRLAHFPRAFAWPALLAVGSALVPACGPDVHTNLYVGLVGPTHSGKSQAGEYATSTLGLEPPALLDCTAGSAEALMRRIADAAGNPRLFSPDELGHTLEKLQIDRSSFPFVLNTAYYKTRFEVLMGRGVTTIFDCRFSMLGGLVEERFQELFNAATIGGLYDRFIFGLCPGNFRFSFRPFEGQVERAKPIAVSIDNSVWKFRASLEKEFPNWNPRVIEHGIRCATICAAFDKKSVLRAEDLDPHLEFIRYQTGIRELLKPNAGENFEGRLANKFLNYLGRQGGRLISRRELFRATRAYDLGPSIADRALDILTANGDVVAVTSRRTKLVRLASEAEALGLEQGEASA